MHGQIVESIFELLGDREDDITFSVGYVLTRCPAFLQSLLLQVFPGSTHLVPESVALQEWQPGSGVTDIEIRGRGLHVVIEAKRGWWLPEEAQLRRYLTRFPEGGSSGHAFLLLAECTPDYAELHHLPYVENITVRYLSWKQLAHMAAASAGSLFERRLLRELQAYLERIVPMQDQLSNLVYVVSLGSDTPAWSELSWVDIVEKRGRYFHPVGKTWPKEPPNYVGFRYRGRLQSIHHVDAWEIVTDMGAKIPEIHADPWGPHYLNSLGLRFGPNARFGRATCTEMGECGPCLIFCSRPPRSARRET